MNHPELHPLPDVQAEESTPAGAEVVAEVSAPAVEDITEVEAAVEAVEASVAEPDEAATPARQRPAGRQLAASVNGERPGPPPS